MVEVPTMTDFIELTKQVQTLSLKFDEYKRKSDKFKSELLILAEIISDATNALLKELEEIS